MTHFLKVKTVDEVLEILGEIKPLPVEGLSLDLACRHMLAEELRASEPVPHFNRAVMDGYAVRARSTFGASETLPALLEICGEVTMGTDTLLTVEPGQAVAIPTGGMLPADADAVVMLEYTQLLDAQTLEVTRAVAPGENVLKQGEDIAQGEVLLPRGWRLRPQDVGMLAALGINTVNVFRQPRVALLSTGDEIVPVSTAVLPPGKIRDVNRYSLAAEMQEMGAIVGLQAVVEDRLEALVAACRAALADHDVVMLSGGSSVGMRDFTVRVLEGFEDAELLVHGIAIRPGKPTILARIGRKVFWGLPGQPVSALMVCRALVLPCLAVLQGMAEGCTILEVGHTRHGVLTSRLPSVHGRTDYVPVALVREGESFMIRPLFGKSAMISVLGRADGYVIVPAHVEGLDAGSRVEAHLFTH